MVSSSESFNVPVHPQVETVQSKILGCGFHLEQLDNGQVIPRSLEGFYVLNAEEKHALLTQAVDSAQDNTGDNRQTLAEATYHRLKGQADILRSDDNAHLPPAERAQDDYNKILAFHNQNLELGLYPESNLTDRALVRTAMMFRNLPPEDLQKIPDIFTAKLGEVTQALVLDFMNTTGYESAGQGAILSPDASNATTKLYDQYRATGKNHEETTVVVFQFIARLNSAVRQYTDITDAPMTNVIATRLIEVAQSTDWENLLKQEIVAQKTETGYARLLLKRQPTLAYGRPHINYLDSPEGVQLPQGDGLWIAGGGGGDVWTAGFLAEKVFTQTNPQVVSVWGEPQNIRNADPIGDSGRIFRVRPETTIVDTRYMEPLLAARGIATFLVCLERRPDSATNLIEDFTQFADYLDSIGRLPSHIALVDTGGDVLAPSSLDAVRPERDHLSLQATRYLQQLCGIAGNLMIAAPGVDAPDTMNEVAEQTGVNVLDLSPYGKQFIELADSDTIMTDDPTRYSRMLQSLYYALHPRTQKNLLYDNHPLQLPVEQALKRTAARPAFNVVTPEMSELHIYNLARVASVTGVNF